MRFGHPLVLSRVTGLWIISARSRMKCRTLFCGSFATTANRSMGFLWRRGHPDLPYDFPLSSRTQEAA